VVRALASHQCVPGSIPGPGVICGLSLLLVLALAPKVFLRVLRFSSLHKINISKFQFDREFEVHGFVSRRLLCATLVKQSQFIFYLFTFIEPRIDKIKSFNAGSSILKLPCTFVVCCSRFKRSCLFVFSPIPFKQ